MSISRNVVWNGLGSLLPMAAGVLVVPVIINHLGAERFGVLSGVWLLIGYFSIFDLGLSRTLTKAVADRIASGRQGEIPRVVATTLLIVAVSGATIGILTMLASGPISRQVAGSSPEFLAETSAALAWLSISLPFVLLATALAGLLEAYQKFALLMAVRVPMGTLVYVLPLVMVPFTTDIGIITAALVLLRVVNAAVLLKLGRQVLPEQGGKLRYFDRALVRPLLSYGGWLTLSNVVSPIMVYFDRFMIAGVLGGAAIAYYTVPYDVVTRLSVFPAAIQGVLFPALIALRAQSLTRLVTVFARSSETTLLLLTPALLAVVFLAHEGLNLWVGEEFATASTRVSQVLMVGVLFNSMARTPFTFVQGEGRASWAAMVHVVEMPIYVLVLWWALREHGIEGAAWAWSGRMVVDTFVFYRLAVRLEGGLRTLAVRDVTSTLAVCVIAVGFETMVASTAIRIAVVAIVCVLCGLVLLARLRGAIIPTPRSRAVAPESQ